MITFAFILLALAITFVAFAVIIVAFPLSLYLLARTAEIVLRLRK